MTNDRDTTNGPFPANPPDPGGDDSWKAQRTDCWPRLTPERVADHERMMTPLDERDANVDPMIGMKPWRGPGASPEVDEFDPGTEEVADDEGMAFAADDPNGDLPGPQVPHERVPAQFAETMSSLDGLDQRPVSEHAQTFDAVHRDLRSALDDIG